MVEIDYIAHMLLQDTVRCTHTDPRIVSQWVYQRTAYTTMNYGHDDALPYTIF
jgi:hypothetical protein